MKSFACLLCIVVLLASSCSSLRLRKVYNLKEAVADPSFNFDQNQHENILLDREDPVGSIRIKRIESNLLDVSPANWTSYTAYVKTNQKCNSALFGWFFEHPDNDAPIVLWLQGGPGASSMMALFLEHGPFVVYKNLTIGNRPIAWTDKYSVLYLDNPVGTGFSYTDNRTECYAHVVDDAVQGVYTFLKAFFAAMGLNGSKLVVTGESYGGKYVPALANYIIKHKEAKSLFDFRGIAVGNGWIDPINQMNLSALLYQIALIDDRERNNMTQVQQEVAALIQKQKWLDAFNRMNYLIDGDLNAESLFTDLTGLNYYLNFLYTNSPLEMYFVDWLNLNSTRQWIGVGNVTFSDGHLVEYHMRQDICQSVRPRLENILNSGYEVLLYNGQLDVIVAPVFTEQMISVMQWKQKAKYMAAPRQIWKVQPDDNQVAGYIKEADNFHFAVIRDAGHLAPADQPRASFDLVSKFIDSITQNE